MRSSSPGPAAARTAHAAGAAYAAGTAALLIALAVSAAPLAVTAIDFAPAVNAKWPGYGAAEAATLRKAIRAAVAREKECSAVPEGVGVTVTVEDLAPSRPTREQLADNPSLDVVHSKSLGGAELKGEVLDAQQHVLTTASYRYFAPTITVGSVARRRTLCVEQDAGFLGDPGYGGAGPVLTRTRSGGRSHLRNASCTAAASSAM